MKIKTKNILLILLLVLLVSLFSFKSWRPKPEKLTVEQSTEQYQPKEWQKYTDENLGIEILHPAWAKPFKEKMVYFAECDDCMGLLNIGAQKIYDQKIDEVYQENKGSEYVVGKIKIDGETAIETIPYEEYTTLSNSRKYYAIHGEYFYTIYDRLNQNEQDREKFLKGFRFSSAISQTPPEAETQ